MIKLNSDIALISDQNRAYIQNNRGFAQRYRADRKHMKKDAFSICYNWHLRKWERVMLKAFALLAMPHDATILRYSDHSNIVRYRELDFVSRLEEEKLIFCELKLKSHFQPEISAKSAGWKQLNTALNIAGQRYEHLSGVAVCVDMFSIYQDEDQLETPHYCTLDDLRFALNNPTEHKTLWLDAMTLCDFAMDHNLLCNDDIDEMHQAYHEFKNPLSVLPIIENPEITNNPFAMLRSA